MVAARVRAVVALAAVLSGGGACFGYVAPRSAVPENAMIRLTLTDRGRVDIAAAVGPRAASLDGVLQARTDSAYTVSVRQVTRLNGVDETWNGEPVSIAGDGVASIAIRQFSAVRTTEFTAAAVAVALAVRSALSGVAIFGGGGSRTGGTK